MATVAQLAYELSLRALDQQEASLRELRARTGTLLAASSLTASFLGAPALQGGLTIPVALALVAFCAVVILSLTALLSQEGFAFAVDGSAVDRLLEGCDRDEACRRLARWLESIRASNQQTIDVLLRRFAQACLALLAEIVLLALALAVR